MFSVSLFDLQNCKFYIFLTDYEKPILVSFILEGPLCRYSFIYMTVYWSEDEFTKEPAESCCCFDCSWPDNNKAWKWSCVVLHWLHCAVLHTNNCKIRFYSFTVIRFNCPNDATWIISMEPWMCSCPSTVPVLF